MLLNVFLNGVMQKRFSATKTYMIYLLGIYFSMLWAFMINELKKTSAK